MKRVIFKDDPSRDLFFNKVLEASGFKFWKELRDYLHIPKSRLEYYRKGVHSLPFERYQNLKRILPKKEQDYFTGRVGFIENYWGAKKGGLVTSRKHKEIFTKGRKLAWEKNTVGFNKNPSLNKEICEFIGAFIGDGFTNRYNTGYLVQFTGDSRFDYEYYKWCIIPTVLNHFGIKAHIRRLDNTLRINFYSKILHDFLIKRCNFPAGKKSYTVKIPRKIMRSNNKVISAMLRGLYDTDGCIFFDKRPIYNEPYPRVQIKLINKPLIKQIYELLKYFNLNPTITKDGYVIQINGREYVKRFIREIGFSNLRHKNRIRMICPGLLK